jgi:predicted transcriptional regulator of viral defense system
MPIMPGRVYSPLLELATDQYGYVSTDDARKLGISPRRLKLLAERDTLWRVARGLYRFPAEVVPVTALDQYMEATLWPGGRGVISHDTALAIYELSDVNPSKVHITVPRGYRTRRKEIPAVFVFHPADLAEDEMTLFEGIPIVTPLRAIRDAHARHLGPALIAQAIDDGERQGLLAQTQADALRQETGVKAGVGMRR